MTANKSMLDGDISVRDGTSATACASALRKVHALAATTPARGVFAAIATLTELSEAAGNSLEAAGWALKANDPETSALELARARVLMDRLTGEATEEEPAATPSYLRKRAPGSGL